MRRLWIMPEMWSGWGLRRGRGPLYMLGLKRAPVRMGRLRRRCCQACKEECLREVERLQGGTYELVVDYSPHLDIISPSIYESSETLKHGV